MTCASDRGDTSLRGRRRGDATAIKGEAGLPMAEVLGPWLGEAARPAAAQTLSNSGRADADIELGAQTHALWRDGHLPGSAAQ
jgi:hypothetical protein